MKVRKKAVRRVKVRTCSDSFILMPTHVDGTNYCKTF